MTAECSPKSITLKAGERAELPRIAVTAKIAEHFPYTKCELALENSSITWTSDTAAVEITADNYIQAVSEGTGTISASVNGINVSCKITVSKADTGTDNTAGNVPETPAADTPTVPETPTTDTPTTGTDNAPVTNTGNDTGTDNGNAAPQKVTVKKVNISSIKNTGKGKIKVKWLLKEPCSGSQVQYALNKNFTSGKRTKNAGSTAESLTITGLKKGKTYYVRVRTYKTVGGRKYYGAWSTVKKVKISK